MLFTQASQLEPAGITWLWHGRIPLGFITILEGPTGMNKSSLTRELVTAITTGQPMPVTNDQVSPSNCIVFDAENDLGYVRRCLDQIGANSSRVFIVGIPSANLTVDGLLQELETQLQECSAKLVVFDPFSKYFDKVINDAAKLRRVLEQLQSLAKKYNLAVVCIRHWVKSASRNSLDRGMGSSAFSQYARSVLAMVNDPKQNDKRVLIQTKSNLGAISPDISLQPYDKGGLLAVKFLGETQIDRQEIGRDPMQGRQLNEAIKFLYQQLSWGPKPCLEVCSCAKQQCISTATLRRAKSALQVESQKSGFGSGHPVYWCLPEGDANSAIHRECIDELCNHLSNGSPLDRLTQNAANKGKLPPGGPTS